MLSRALEEERSSRWKPGQEVITVYVRDSVLTLRDI